MFVKLRRLSEGWICTGLWAVAMLMTAVLCFWIRPASDDFYYVTFGDGGWKSFLEINLEHYLTMSGRVFVHLVLYPLLCLDMWPLRIFVVGLIGCVSAMMARLTVQEPERRAQARVVALGVFWLMGIETLQDGVLWGAGALNYLFPISLVLAYGLLMQRVLEGKGSLWLGVPAFLCACTVEMTGVLPCVVFAYLCMTNWQKVRTHWRTVLTVGLCTLAGYLFLYTSPGVAVRIESNSAGVTLFEKILVNYSMIDRRVIGPEGIWPVTALTLLTSGLVLGRDKLRWGFGMMLLAAAVTLTGLGIVYDGVAVALIALLAFCALAAFAVCRFLCGERQVPLWMLCTTASLGVCLMSPVMGSRLVMPTAVFLTVICVRNFMELRLDRRSGLAVTAALTAAACLVLVADAGHLARNARVIDENHRLALEHKDGILLQELVPDERYSGPAVPVASGFGSYYLRHYGLSGIQYDLWDPTECAVLLEGEQTGLQALLRDGIWYVPLRDAGEAIGAEVRWEMASAVVELEERTICFHLGNQVANLGHGITGSVKLSGPVRNIGGRIYIPLADFCKLFDQELTVQVE